MKIDTQHRGASVHTHTHTYAPHSRCADVHLCTQLSADWGVISLYILTTHTNRNCTFQALNFL